VKDGAAGAPGDAHPPRSDNLECGNRRVGPVPQFVRLPVARGGLSARVLGDGAGNRVVQALIHCAKVFRDDRRRQFHGQVSDRLTHRPVVLDDFGQREPFEEQVISVVSRGPAHRAGLRRAFV